MSVYNRPEQTFFIGRLPIDRRSDSSFLTDLTAVSIIASCVVNKGSVRTHWYCISRLLFKALISGEIVSPASGAV